jgi:hypothetical protein
MEGLKMFLNALAGAIDAAHPKQFDYLSRQLWQAHAAGHIPDDDAQSMAERLHRRRAFCYMQDSSIPHNTLAPIFAVAGWFSNPKNTICCGWHDYCSNWNGFYI